MIARTARQFPFVIALVVVLALAPIALAGKGSGGGGGGHKPPAPTTGNLNLVMVTDTGTAGVSWGDTVTFSFTQSVTTEPHVDLTCSQGGTVVYGATAGFYASYPWPWTVNMTLSSQSWSAGSASCVANLYYFNGSSKVSLASKSFTAAA